MLRFDWPFEQAAPGMAAGAFQSHCADWSYGDPLMTTSGAECGTGVVFPSFKGCGELCDGAHGYRPNIWLSMWTSDSACSLLRRVIMP